jgi:hypothetical protein
MPPQSRPDDNRLIYKHLAKFESCEYCSRMGFKLSLEPVQNRIGKGPRRLHRGADNSRRRWFYYFVFDLFWAKLDRSQVGSLRMPPR